MTIFINGKIKEKSEFMLPPESLPIKFVEKVPDPADIPLNNIAMCQDPAGRKWLATNRSDVIHMVELTEGFHADYGGAASSEAEPRLETVRALARIQLANTIVCTNDPEKLGGAKVEFVAGNITQDLDKMRIVGGTPTATGNSWMFWDLPSNVTKVYVRVRFYTEPSQGSIAIDLCNASGVTIGNPPDYYNIHISTQNAAKDFILGKNVGGVWTEIDYEPYDLSIEEWYDIEVYLEGDGAGSNKIIVWRDGYEKFNYSETETNVTSIASIRFRVWDNSTSIAEACRFGKPFIILTEA